MTTRKSPARPTTVKARSDRQGLTTCLLTVCRGCCCGTLDKHPDTDHRGQLQTLPTSTDSPQVLLRVSDCLDACEHSNVIVVNASPAGRRRGARPTWLGEVLDDTTTQAVLAWVAAGGPGSAELPDNLLAHLFTPPRRVRQAGPT